MIAGFAPDHPSWAALRAVIDERIEKSRDMLTVPGLDIFSSEHQRGRIAALRDLIDAVEAVPIETVAQVPYA